MFRCVHKLSVGLYDHGRHMDSPKTECLRRLIADEGIKNKVKVKYAYRITFLCCIFIFIPALGVRNIDCVGLSATLRRWQLSVGGELYREYRHDAVELRYDSIMLLLVRLNAAVLHRTALHPPESRHRCHDARCWNSVIVCCDRLEGTNWRLRVQPFVRSCKSRREKNFDVFRKPKPRVQYYTVTNVA